MIAYPGRTFGQLYHRFVKGNALVSGAMELGGRTISLADITAPVLVFGGATDGIAPVAVGQGRRAAADRREGGALRDRPGWPPRHADRPPRAHHHLAGARRVGRAVVQRRRGRPHAGREEDVEEGAGQEGSGQEGATAKKAPSKQAAAKKAPAKKAAGKKSASAEAIGANPSRRYGSGGSRALSR